MLRYSILGITRKPLTTFVLLLIFIAFGSFQFVQLTLFLSAKASKDATIKAIGSYLTLGSVEEPSGLTPKLIDKIKALPDVIAVDSYVEGAITPINFSLSEDHTGIDPKTQEIVEDVFSLRDKVGDMVLIGAVHHELAPDFTRSLARLKEGDFPSAQSPGVMIEQRVVEKNRLKLGDKLDFNFENSKAILPLVGIYETDASFEITKDNTRGEKIYIVSPYNRFYTDMENARKILKDTGDPFSVNVHVNSPKNMDSVYQALTALVDPTRFNILDNIDFMYEVVGKQVESVYSLSGMTLLFSSLIITAVLLFLVSLYSKIVLKESAVLLALGASKGKIIGAKALQFLLIGGFSSLISVSLGTVALRYFEPQLLPKTVEEVNMAVISPYLSNTDTIVPPAISLDGSFTVFLALLALMAAIALLMGLYTGFYILSYRPRELLTRE